MPIIAQVVALGALGLVLGGTLGYVGRIFAVKEDPRISAIRAALPGVNCGACGYPGCDGFAMAVADGISKTSGCPIGGPDLSANLAEIMGVEPPLASKQVAYVHCCGNSDVAKTYYAYDGIDDCNATSLLPGKGPKACTYSCIGHSSCVVVCPFNAIDIINTIAVVNPDKCVACGLCIPSCPKGLIELVPDDAKIRVECHSTDRGAVVRSNCSGGCIACKICEKNCPHNAIHATNNLAQVDYEKCTQCGICVDRCPTKAIKNITE